MSEKMKKVRRLLNIVGIILLVTSILVNILTTTFIWKFSAWMITGLMFMIIEVLNWFDNKTDRINILIISICILCLIVNVVLEVIHLF